MIGADDWILLQPSTPQRAEVISKTPPDVLRIDLDEFDGTPQRKTGEVIRSKPTLAEVTDLDSYFLTTAIADAENGTAAALHSPTSSTVLYPSVLDVDTSASFGMCMLERLSHLKRTSLYPHAITKYSPSFKGGSSRRLVIGMQFGASSNPRDTLLDEALDAIHHTFPNPSHSPEVRAKRAEMLTNQQPMPSRASALGRFKADQRAAKTNERKGKKPAVPVSNILTVRTGTRKARESFDEPQQPSAVPPAAPPLARRLLAKPMKAPSSSSLLSKGSFSKGKRKGDLSDSLSSSDEDGLVARKKRPVPTPTRKPEASAIQQRPLQIQTTVVTTHRTERTYHTIPLL